MKRHQRMFFTNCLASLFFLLLVQQAPAFAQTPESPQDIARRLQARYDQMQSLSFEFFQDTRGETTGGRRQGSGEAFFVKGADHNRMRWDYSLPNKQVLLSDGIQFIMYFAELNQMIISPAESLEKEMTYSFFSGSAKLKDGFDILPAEADFHTESSDNVSVIQLVPLVPHSQVQDIHLWVTDDSLLQRITIRDHFGTLTVLNLSNIVANALENTTPEKLEQLFSFVPPEGVEIIEQERTRIIP
ncbi:MAG: hypothetical protein CSB23_01755 [Deltaproteobacteria bacterium]|nr:MAG: hypothetical protein CSB23_01755 [Deltaproteobacteria bacterium]